jgi:hypothetical protein
VSDLAEILERVFARDASAEEEGKLTVMLAAGSAERREYGQQMKIHALLEWRGGRVAESTEPPETIRIVAFPAPARKLRIPWAIAAMLATMALFAPLLWLRHHGSERQAVALEVLFTDRASLVEAAAQPRAGDRLQTRRLSLREGILRARLGSGAILGAEGPAQIELLSDMRVRVLSGRVTVEAGAAHGFTVETARTRIVDLGTRFGVDAAAAGTDVVVFEGAVELHDPQLPAAAPQRLVEGEGVHLASNGGAQPLMTIATGVEREQWSAGAGGVIRSLRDNRRHPEALKYYQVVPAGLKEDTRAYVDREHQWNGVDAKGLPAFLQGADLVRTFNDDKRETELEITIELEAPAVLYLFLDKKPPEWVAQAGFVNTGEWIGLDEGPSSNRAAATDVGPGASIDRVLSVWKLEVRQPGPIKLGPPRAGATGAKAMYGIAARKLELL